MPRLIPNLWFHDQAEEAAEFYAGIFPNSRITMKTHYPEDSPGEAGTVMTVEFELDGQPLVAINGGPHFQFSEATSLLVECADQAEIDFYWDRLREGGGQAMECGWLKDRYGFPWQVVPKGMDEVFVGDPARAQRAMTAMLGMKKIDMAAMRRAADGEAVAH